MVKNYPNLNMHLAELMMAFEPEERELEVERCKNMITTLLPARDTGTSLDKRPVSLCKKG